MPPVSIDGRSLDCRRSHRWLVGCPWVRRAALSALSARIRAMPVRLNPGADQFGDPAEPGDDGSLYRRVPPRSPFRS